MKVLTKEEEEALKDEIKEKYETELSPYYAASRLWIDAIIDPLETRKWVSIGIESANNGLALAKFNPGVLQV